MPTIKDKFEFLAGYGQCAVVILGNVAKRDYEVIDLETATLGPDHRANYAERGLGFIGTFALIDGQFRSAYAVQLEADVIVALAEDYARFVLRKLTNPSSNGDGAEWLSRLWELPDIREN